MIIKRLTVLQTYYDSRKKFNPYVIFFLNIYLSISFWHLLYSAALIRSQHIFLRKEVVNTSNGAQTHENYAPLIMFQQA